MPEILKWRLNQLFFLRKRFPKKVNCWFCNSDTRVEYECRNSWDCPSCQQYNGFEANGDYNKEIPAQHSSKFNITSYCQKPLFVKLPAPANGLCNACNRNQEIKVIQLANFKAKVSSAYDLEIEEYR